jgi:hypothetical protein
MKGFKIKGAKEPRVPWSGALDGVRYMRTVQLQTRHPRVSLGLLRYNSPDCPMCHRTVCAPAEQRLLHTTVNYKSRWLHEQWRTVRAEVRGVARGAPDSEQCLSGATRRQSSNGRLRPNPNGWVTWLTHRTVSGAPIESSSSPTVVWWLRSINTPQPPPLQSSKHSSHFIQYKSKVQHSKTQIKATDPIKVPNSILVL